jgi:hypothetical protein
MILHLVGVAESKSLSDIPSRQYIDALFAALLKTALYSGAVFELESHDEPFGCCLVFARRAPINSLNDMRH